MLVADIVGFTALTESSASRGASGIEELQQIFNQSFERIVGVIRESGGEVYKFAGDAPIAYWFNEPDSLREAVHAAAATGLRLQTLVADLARAVQMPLQLRIGIGAGNLFTAIYGGVSGRWEAYLGGDALLQIAGTMTASAGETVLSPQAHAIIQEECTGRASASHQFALEGITPFFPGRTNSLIPPTIEASLEPFVPRHVVSRLRALEDDWKAELRFVCVMFAHIKSVKDLEALQSATVVVQRCVYGYGGSTVQCLLDESGHLAAIAAWGIPGSSFTNDAERAVRAAHAIRRELEAGSLEVSVGIASGPLFSGLRGGSSRAEFALVGSAINLAARLAKSAPDELRCDRVTADAIDGIAFAEVPLDLKGFGSVVGFEPRGRRSPSEFVNLVGRDAELGVLSSALQRLNEDMSCNVLVVVDGPPGIGKSHLCAAFVEKTRNSGIPVSVGASDELDEQGTYRPLRSVLDSLLGLDPDRLSGSREDRILELLADSEQRAHAALLGDVLGSTFAEPPAIKEMGGQIRLDATANLLARLVEASFEGQARIVLLEDSQWLDSSSWAVIESVVRLTRGLLVILVMRTVGEHWLPPQVLKAIDASSTVRLRVGSIPEPATRHLIGTQIKVAVVPDSLVRWVHQGAQGTPLFVRQIVRGLLADKVVHVESGMVSVDEERLSTKLAPSNIQSAVTSRFSELFHDQLETLKRASVIGQSFSIGTLAGAFAADSFARHIDEQIESLVERKLVKRGDDPGEFHFDHALVREAVYEQITPTERRRLHTSLANWYRDKMAGIPRYFGLIAKHYDDAHDLQLVGEALKSAGDQFLRVGAHREAAKTFRRLLDIAESGFDASDRRHLPATRNDLARWNIKLGQATYDLGNLNESRMALESAARILGHPIPSGRAILATLLWEATRALLGELMPPPAKPFVVSTHDRQLVRLLAMLGRNYNLSQIGDLTLLTVLRRFNLLARRQPVAELMAALAGMMYVATLFGRRRVGDRFAARIVDVNRRLQHPLRYAEASYVVALSLMLQARWEECEGKAIEAEGIADRMGEGALGMAILAVRANAAELRGRFDRARALSGLLRDRAAAAGDMLKQCWAIGCLAITALRQGKYEEAADLARASLEIANSIGESATAFAMSGTLTLCAWRTKDPDNALVLAESCIQRLREIRRISTAHHLLVGLEMLSEATLAMLDDDLFPRASAEWEMSARRTSFVLARLRLHGSLVAVGATIVASRRATWHWLQGRSQRAISGWKRAIALAEESSLPYSSAAARIELARHLAPNSGERLRHLEMAAESLRGIGAERVLTACLEPSAEPARPSSAASPSRA